VQQLNLVLRFATADAITVKHGHADLAVDTQIRFVLTRLNHDLDL